MIRRPAPFRDALLLALVASLPACKAGPRGSREENIRATAGRGHAQAPSHESAPVSDSGADPTSALEDGSAEAASGASVEPGPSARDERLAPIAAR